MRLSKQRTEENHSRILEAATRLFQQHGFDRVGVAELMREAGFTHGGFYNHFESKEALAAEACASVLARANETLAERLRSRNATAWKAYVADCLTPEHALSPSDRMSFASLAADASRQGDEVQATFAAGIEATLSTLSAYLADRTTRSTRLARRAARTQAVQRLSALVGACVLARAISRGSTELSREILAANADARGAALGPQAGRRTGRAARAAASSRARR
jgi:TetR/AcrR family transcriptional repressor of nem operon